MYPILVQFLLPNTDLGCIAASKKYSGKVLPPIDISKLGITHDEDNKLDTQYSVIVYTSRLKQNISAWIYLRQLEMRGVLVEVIKGIRDLYIRTLKKLLSKHLNVITKISSREPRDLTAYVKINKFNMRRRSFHSIATSRLLNSKKENKKIKKSHKDQVLEDNFHTWLKIELQKCLDKDNKYNGLINILSNEKFLIKAYELIKSKPGNSTKGTDNETLDGINKK